MEMVAENGSIEGDIPAKIVNTWCCLLCSGDINNAYYLDCQHSFCKSCLYTYYESNKRAQYDDLTVSCPTCGLTSTLPDSGTDPIKGHTFEQRQMRFSRTSILMIDSQLCDTCILRGNGSMREAKHYCNRCSMNFCETCNTNHNHASIFRTHQSVPISSKEIFSLNCEDHNKLPCKYFCSDCKYPLCTACVVIAHARHTTLDFRHALSQLREDLRAMLTVLTPKLDKLISKYMVLHGYLSSPNPDTALDKLNLSTEADETKGLLSEESHRQNPTCDDPVSPSVKTGGNNGKRDMLPKQNGIMNSIIKHNKLDKISTSCPEFSEIQVNVKRILVFHTLAMSLLEIAQSRKLLALYEDVLGRMKNILNNELNHIRDAINVIIRGRFQTTPAISTIDSSFNLAEHSGDVLNTRTSVVRPAKQSLLLTPKLLWKIEKQRNDVGELYNPCDVDFLPDGNLIVAEYDMINDKNNRLRIFDQEGNTKDILAQGKIRPLGVAITRDGNLVVTDCKDKKLKIFTTSGQFITDVGKGQFGWPYGVAVNSHGQIIVTDAFNDNISIYNHEGKKIKQFGSSGANTNQFKNPYHLAVDAKDNILVSDSGNNCVKVFDHSGRFIFKTSEVRRKMCSDYGELRKTRRKKLKGPRGICIDHRGNILVADDYSRICMLDDMGNFIRNLMTEDDHVKYPEAISCSRNGQIAVTEWNPNNMLSIKLYNMYQ